MIVQRSQDRGKLVARNALRGGVVGLETGLVIVATTVRYLNIAELVFAPLGVGILVAGLIALVGLLVQRRSRSLNLAQAELEQALAMLERGMIDDEDYRRIKDRVLEAYEPRQRDVSGVLRWAFRGGVTGATVPLVLLAGNGIQWGIGGAGIGIILAATILGSGIAAGSSTVAQVIQNRRQPTQLPAAEHRMLGE